MTKKITLKDVALKTGVSVGAVSGILNGRTNFLPETQKKVWDTANSMGYVPNLEAKNLRAGLSNKTPKTNIIMHITHTGTENPFDYKLESWRSMLIAWEAQKKGLFTTTYWYYQEKGFACPPILNGYIDGAIVGTPHIKVIEALKNKIPLVLMDVPFLVDEVNAPMVNLDFRRGYLALFKELKKRGHKKIGILRDCTLFGLRLYSAMLEAAVLCEIEIHSDFMKPVEINPQTHQAVMSDFADFAEKHIRNKEITAIVCSNEVYSNALYEIFSTKGISIPEELSLAGGGTSCRELNDSNITTLEYNWPEMVRTSIEMLKEMLEGNRRAPNEILIKPEIFLGSTIGEALK